MSCAWLDGARHPDGRQQATKFGKRVAIDGLVRSTMGLDHIDGPKGYASQETRPAQGLRTTRFNKGFQRRLQGAINQDAWRKESEAHLAAVKAERSARRRAELAETASYNGFDPISGTYDPAKIRNERKKARYLPDRPSDELLRSGDICVRNSHYRYYVHNPAGPEHDRRQARLVNEGLSKPKFSSRLGYGRAEEVSFGVEDQFSRSQYQPEVAKNCPPGLVEKRRPGAYAPPAAATGRERIFGATWRPE